MLVSYSGAGYYGMQINGDFPTVEKDLFQALQKLSLIENCGEKFQPSLFKFQRAARTDKGVSAVHQICSISLRVSEEELTDLPKTINGYLPPKVRVLGFKRATKGFDAKSACSARTYSYTLPTYAFAHVNEKTDETFRMDDTRLEEVNNILKIYRGTHNFFNFTSRKEHGDESCKRYIISCQCGKPFLYENVEFATIDFKGQSFVLHQIRKMVGLCIAIIRGFTDKSMVQKAWESKRVHYESYDKKFGNTHVSLDSWPDCEEVVEQHKRDWILPQIYDGEIKTKSMMGWLSTLLLHVYDKKDDSDECNANSSPSSPFGKALEAVKQQVNSDKESEALTNETKEGVPE